MNKPPMKTAAEALEHLLAQAKPEAGVEVVCTQDALGRILASDILSQVDVPPMNNTQMDGYAVRVADVRPYPPQSVGFSRRFRRADPRLFESAQVFLENKLWKIILLMQFTVVDVGAVTVGGPMLSKRTLKELVASVHIDIE